MPKGSNDGSIFKRKEIRVVFKGSKRDEKEVEQYYARVRYTDLKGRKREKKRRANPNTYAQACAVKRALEAEIEQELQSPEEQKQDRTFRELAESYKDEYMIPPQYIAEKKVSGLRSHKALLTFYNPLVEHFEDSLLHEITYDEIKAYKILRLSTPAAVTKNNKKGRQRSVAAVDRELQLLRRMFSIAQHRRWIKANPFKHGDALIVVAHEAKRMRILSHEEETQLLAACGERTYNYVWKGKEYSAKDSGVKRLHLRAAIICALDTALRANEQFTLTRPDISLDDLVIRVREMNAKVEKERFVPISERLRVELEKLLARTTDDRDEKVFPHDRVRRSFTNACASVGITGFRWHDLRHTAIMRMLESGLPESEVMTITGHTSYTTFMRYVSLNKDRLRAAAAMMDARRARVEEEAKKKEQRETVH